MKTIALSSTEADYIALSIATTEIVYLRRLLQDLGFKQSEPTLVYEDNMSAIKMVTSPQLNHQTTKHVRVKYHYTRQMVKEQVVRIRYVPTDRMVADILTKALPLAQHEALGARLENW